MRCSVSWPVTGRCTWRWQIRWPATVRRWWWAPGYRLDIRDVRRQCPKSFLLLPECDGENAVPAFDEYGHGAMLVDFDLQYAEEPAQAVPAAAQLLKQWVTVV